MPPCLSALPKVTLSPLLPEPGPPGAARVSSCLNSLALAGSRGG